MDSHDNVSGGEAMTESSKPNPVYLEADARERQAGADSPEVQPLQKRIITLEDLHQHVLDLAADLEIEWSDWRTEADTETRTVYLHPITSERAYTSALHEIGHIAPDCLEQAARLGRHNPAVGGRCGGRRTPPIRKGFRKNGQQCLCAQHLNRMPRLCA